MFRALKGYDVIINFISMNAKIFLTISKAIYNNRVGRNKKEKLSQEILDHLEKIIRLFRECFRILEGFCYENNTNKR